MTLLKNNTVILLLILVLVTLLRWTFSAPADATRLSDLFFIHGSVGFIFGLLIYIVSTARIHYYRHLRDRFSGKVTDDKEFDIKARQRTDHAKKGGIVALIGFVGILLSGLVVYIKQL